jgi:hypothetical protein
MMASKSPAVVFDTYSPLQLQQYFPPAWTCLGSEGKAALPARKSVPIPAHVTGFKPTKPYLVDASAIAEQNHHSQNLEFNFSLSVFDYSKRHLKRKMMNKISPISGSETLKADRSTTDLSESLKAFEDLKVDTVQGIRSKLMRSRYFSINELYKQVEQKETFEQELEEMKQHSKQLPDFETIDLSQFVMLCTNNKYQSRAVQTLIEAGTPEQKRQLYLFCEQSVDQLLTNKYGNYILQQAVRSSGRIAEVLELKCLRALSALVKNEYASRVMQALSEVSDSFRLAVLNWFTVGLETSIETLSAVFLFTSSIQFSRSREELELIKSTLFSKSAKKISGCKYFKRIMMSFVEICDTADLDLVFDTFKCDKKFLTLLDDKFGALLVFSMIGRHHEHSVRILLSNLKDHLLSLYETKYFKFLLFRLVKADSLHLIKSRMLQALANSSSQTISNATSCVPSCYFLAYLVISLLSPDSFGLLTKLSGARS